MTDRKPEVAKPPWRTIVVFAYALLLVAQGMLSFLTKPEPYPSIRMPGFGPAADADETFRVVIERAEYSDQEGRTYELDPSDLMAEFRFSTARPSFEYLFRTADPSRITPEVRQWLKDRILQTGGNAVPVSVQMCWQDARISIRDATTVTEGPCEWRVIKL